MTSIDRDVFGKPTAITRGASGITATFSYLNDANVRPCVTNDPETGAMGHTYDAASNVLWRASRMAAMRMCDTNGNITDMNDLPQGIRSRTMTDEGLDNLASVNAPKCSGFKVLDIA